MTESDVKYPLFRRVGYVSSLALIAALVWVLSVNALLPIARHVAPGPWSGTTRFGQALVLGPSAGLTVLSGYVPELLWFTEEERSEIWYERMTEKIVEVFGDD